MSQFTATTMIAHAKENGWTVSYAETKNAPDWRADKSCGMKIFDWPTHIVTFKRGDSVATMPVTPHARDYGRINAAKTMPKASEIHSWRYVRGNRELGQMLGTDGKPVLIDALGAQLAAKPKAAKPRAATKRTRAAKPEAAAS